MRPLQDELLAGSLKQRRVLIPRPLLCIEERHGHQVHLPIITYPMSAYILCKEVDQVLTS